MKERTRARGWTLQILYAWEIRGAGDLEAIARSILAERRVASSSMPYIRRLVTAVAEHHPEIDEAIQESLTNWRLERLSAIDRNVLRLAAAELLFFDDVPPRVSIQEAVLLAEKYGTAESPRFVNGVLDALMRRAGAGASGGGSAP